MEVPLRTFEGESEEALFCNNGDRQFYHFLSLLQTDSFTIRPRNRQRAEM